MIDAAAELKAGAVVARGRRWFVLIGIRQGSDLAGLMLRRADGDRLRSHLVPGAGEVRLAGMPMDDVVIWCDRIRWIPLKEAEPIGTVSPCLVTKAHITLRRVMDAERSEAGSAARTTIWRCPGGDRGRRIGGAGAG